VSLLVTTTRTDLDEETAGRFVTLSVDESREQTRAILQAQRCASMDIIGKIKLSMEKNAAIEGEFENVPAARGAE